MGADLEKKPVEHSSKETVHIVPMKGEKNEFDVYGDEESAESTSCLMMFMMSADIGTRSQVPDAGMVESCSVDAC